MIVVSLEAKPVDKLLVRLAANHGGLLIVKRDFEGSPTIVTARFIAIASSWARFVNYPFASFPLSQCHHRLSDPCFYAYSGQQLSLHLPIEEFGDVVTSTINFKKEMKAVMISQ